MYKKINFRDFLHGSKKRNILTYSLLPLTPFSPKMLIPAAPLMIKGYAIIIGAGVVLISLAAYQRYNKGNIYKAFKSAGLMLNDKIYPKVHEAKKEGKTERYTFTIPTGMDPKEIDKKEYVFKQVFGPNINIEGDHKQFKLHVYDNESVKDFTYNKSEISDTIKRMKLPIICGKDLNGRYISYDMVKHPHLLIAGETGSGKSTQLRSILTTLILNKSPDDIELYLGDMKMSEFHIFRHVKHVKGVYYRPDEIKPILQRISDEMKRREKLLNTYEVSHIDDVPEKIPYILLAIDEVQRLRDDDEVMNILEDISAIGRALGVFLTLSLQRPDSKVMDGKIKNNLTVRMGFQTSNRTNANIIDTPGSEKLTEPGRMLLKLKQLEEIQAPYLALDEAKKLLEGYKSYNTKKCLEPAPTVPKGNNNAFEVIEDDE